MSDTVVIAVVTAICTALPLVLTQIVNIIRTARKLDAAATQMIEVKQMAHETQATAREAKKATLELSEGQAVIAKSLETNTFDTGEIRAMIAAQGGSVSGFDKLAATADAQGFSKGAP